jgi:hypothetical protein
MTFNSRGKLLTKVEAQVAFQVICAKCGQPVIIASILHFADCPQVSVVPCLCTGLVIRDETRADLAILEEMKDDLGHITR